MRTTIAQVTKANAELSELVKNYMDEVTSLKSKIANLEATIVMSENREQEYNENYHCNLTKLEIENAELKGRIDNAIVEYKKLKTQVPVPVVVNTRELKDNPKYNKMIQVSYKGIISEVLVSKEFARITGNYMRKDADIMMTPVLETMLGVKVYPSQMPKVQTTKR